MGLARAAFVAAALACVAMLPVAPALACHEVVPAFDVGPVHFPGIYIPC